MNGTSGGVRLPLMYQRSNSDEDDLALLLPLCLADSNFPQYVARVEAQLSKLAHPPQ